MVANSDRAMESSRHLHADVVILGSGLAGSVAALCLLRAGRSVVLVDQGTHPRFALGESTNTPASLWLRVIAERFQVPELLHLTSAEALVRHVAPSSGIKNNFGFMYHRPGGHAPERFWQAIIPPAFLGDCERDGQPAQNEMHYFRQDVDAWLWQQALAAGAIARPATEVIESVARDRGVELHTAAGEVLHARFVIDASGHRSPIARQFGLRELPPRWRTDSRTLFTHMVGVEPWENLQLVPDSMARWSQGTLHHCFDGGWIWVIPFGNHRAATNRLCSVGLSFDNRRHPRPGGLDAKAEWDRVMATYPAIAAQFRRAVAVRPWVHTDRVQYSSHCCVGDRWWLTAHAAGAVDALYSMGNISTFHTLAIGLERLLRMFAADDFRREHLLPVEDLTSALFRFQDRVVYGNYVALRDPALLQTWIAIWSLTDTARIRAVLMPLVKYFRTRSATDLAACFAHPSQVLTGVGMRTGITDTTTVLGELDHLCDLMQELEIGRSTPAETQMRIEAALASRPQYCIDLSEMERAFARMPWSFAPLSERGLRSYGSCFLTPHEMNTIGQAP
jgi:FADH2 O2-dependent halogenase